MNNKKRVYVAGHNGMVGSAIVRLLEKREDIELVTRSKTELDLKNQAQVNDFFKNNQIDEVYLAAAKVGGIHANNTYPADFIYDNLMIQANVIHAAHANDIQKLLFLGSSCIYPKEAPQPMKEEYLLTGPLEPTNEPYAIAKIAGIKLCESYNRQYGRDYRSVMPTNLYGPNDNFHPENSHVIPALMRRIHEAKVNGDREVVIWGTGKPRREFLHVDDMARASIFVMELEKSIYSEKTDNSHSQINIGIGEDISISDLAKMIVSIISFQGELVFDCSRLDGSIRKLMDISTLNSLGWRPEVSLTKGLSSTYEWFRDNHS